MKAEGYEFKTRFHHTFPFSICHENITKIKLLQHKGLKDKSGVGIIVHYSRDYNVANGV